MTANMRQVFLAFCLIIALLLVTWIGFDYYLQSGIPQICIGQIDHGPLSKIISTVCTLVPNNHNTTLFLAAVTLTDGRLGNQLFRYASLLGISRTQERELAVSAGSELEKTFRLRHVVRNETVKEWQVMKETNELAFDTKLMNLPYGDIKIKGFLQSFKYFVSIADYLRYEYTFHDAIANDAAIIIDDVHTQFKGSLLVGVHVRRGDYLKDFNIKLGYIIPERSYFIKAFNYMKSFFSGRNITFVVVSDDLPWCSTNLNVTNVVIVPPASASVHLAVLASCDHVIISSGTYSWWGAYLSGGYVIYFTGYMSKNTTFGDIFVAEDYYPSHWIGLSN